MSNFYDELKKRESGKEMNPQRAINGFGYMGFLVPIVPWECI